MSGLLTYPREWFYVGRNERCAPIARTFVRETQHMLFRQERSGERRTAKSDLYGRWYSDRAEAEAVIAERVAHLNEIDARKAFERAAIAACEGIPTPELSTLLGEVRGVLEAWLLYNDRDDDGPNAGIQMMVDYDSALSLTRALLAKLPVQS